MFPPTGNSRVPGIDGKPVGGGMKRVKPGGGPSCVPNALGRGGGVYSKAAATAANRKMFREDNYSINDIHSDDSTDDEAKPKRVIPFWAQGG